MRTSTAAHDYRDLHEPIDRLEPDVDVIHVKWHTIEVFKSHGRQAA